ncbi:Mu transposase C-terminal domain-containing protein [Rhizobium beringeri]
MLFLHAHIVDGLPYDEHRFLLDFLPFEERYVRRDGVHLSACGTGMTSLVPLAGGPGKLCVRYDPRDLSTVFVEAPEGWTWPIPFANLGWPPHHAGRASAGTGPIAAAWRAFRRRGPDLQNDRRAETDRRDGEPSDPDQHAAERGETFTSVGMGRPFSRPRALP